MIEKEIYLKNLVNVYIDKLSENILNLYLNEKVKMVGKKMWW